MSYKTAWESSGGDCAKVSETIGLKGVPASYEEFNIEGHAWIDVRATSTGAEIIVRATRTQDALGEKGREPCCCAPQPESVRYKPLEGIAVLRVCHGVVGFTVNDGTKEM